MKRVADLIVDTLVATGVERIYGLAGDSLNGITDSIRPRDNIKWVPRRTPGTAYKARLRPGRGYQGQTRAPFLPATSELRLSGRRAIIRMNGKRRLLGSFRARLHGECFTAGNRR
jgi:hypothetical protein